MKPKTLYDIAYARSGDKGANANIALFANDRRNYEFLCEYVTEGRIRKHFHALPIEKIERFFLPNLLAINYVLHGVLGEGGSASLKTDSQGKALGQALLELSIEE